MTQFVRTTGGLLQLKSGAVNEKEVAKMREFADRLGYNLARKRHLGTNEMRVLLEGQTIVPGEVAVAAAAAAVRLARQRLAESLVKSVHDELQDLQAKEPEAFR